jgi:hypothetical protein
MPVSSPVFGWAKTPSGLPIPLSVTESFSVLCVFVESLSRLSESQRLTQP